MIARNYHRRLLLENCYRVDRYSIEKIIYSDNYAVVIYNYLN